MAPSLFRLKFFVLLISLPFCIVACVTSEGIDERSISDFESRKDFLPQYCSVAWLNVQEKVSGPKQKLDIFCHKNTSKLVIYMFRQVYLKFVHVPANYKLYGGENENAVCEQYSSETIFNPMSWFLVSWRETNVGYPAFNQYCIGVKTRDQYTVELIVRALNYWKVLQFAIGIILFIYAPSLSRNLIFHYLSGISLGILASILVLLFIASRFVPKKGISYALIVFSYSMVAYFFQLFWASLPDFVSHYPEILIAYSCITAFISFIVCYRLGPVENERTLNIIQWCLQALGLLMIFLSTEHKEAATSIIIVIIPLHICHPYISRKLRTAWYWYFPSKIRLLTESEYIEQGVIETSHALDNLRSFCNSPDCKSWQTVQKLKDPIRFAKFVEGESHITNDEILAYELDCGPNESQSGSDEEVNTSHGDSSLNYDYNRSGPSHRRCN